MPLSRSAPLIGAFLITCISFAAWADEYPKVIRRDGQVCVQELAADGAVKESCRAETTPAPRPSTDTPSGTGWSNRFQNQGTSPRLLDGDLLPDPKGAVRGISELLGGQVAAYLTSIAFIATGVSSTVGGLLGSAVVGFAVSSLVSGLFHLASDGQAGLGWAFLGNLIGQVVSVVFTLAALSSGSAVVTLLAVLIGGFLPALGASVALELRDTAVRREAAGFAPSAGTRGQSGALIASF